MKMKKKIIAVVLAAASVLSLTTSVSAAGGKTTISGNGTGTNSMTGSTNMTIEATALMAIPAVTITWPTAAGVILNPYKMKVDIPTSGLTEKTSIKGSTKATAVDYIILSPELKFKNTGTSKVAITVSGFSANAMTVKGDDGSALATPVPSTKISFTTDPILHEKHTNGSIQQGETENKILMYLEVGTPAYDDNNRLLPNYNYSGTYSKSSQKQLVVGTTDTPAAKTKFFEIDANNGEARIMVCGDMAQNPTVPWSRLAGTEEVNVKIIFDVMLATPFDNE